MKRPRPPSRKEWVSLIPLVPVAVVAYWVVRVLPDVPSNPGATRSVLTVMVSIEAAVMLLALSVAPLAKQLFLQTYYRVGRADRAIFFGYSFCVLLAVGVAAVGMTGWLATQFPDAASPPSATSRLLASAILLGVTMWAGVRYVYSVMNAVPKELKTMHRFLRHALEEGDTQACLAQIINIQSQIELSVGYSKALECQGYITEAMHLTAEVLDYVWTPGRDKDLALNVDGAILTLVKRTGLAVSQQQGKGGGRAVTWVVDRLKSMIADLEGFKQKAEASNRDTENIRQTIGSLQDYIGLVEKGETPRL